MNKIVFDGNFKEAGHYQSLSNHISLIGTAAAKNGEYVEVRILGGKNNTYVGLFTADTKGMQALVSQVLPLDAPRKMKDILDHPRIGEAQIYVTMNPVKELHTPEALNQIVKSYTGASEGDIAAYSMFFVDIDPEVLLVLRQMVSSDGKLKK